MLNDLRDIEGKGYIHPFGDGNPPLVLTMSVTKIQEADRKKGGLSAHLLFSLNCPALTPLGVDVSEKDPNSTTNNKSNSSYHRIDKHGRDKRGKRDREKYHKIDRSHLPEEEKYDGNEDNRDRNERRYAASRDQFSCQKGDLSAVANQDDYSAIIMTCIALTSRAEGHFSITRNKVEFSIACGGRDSSSYHDSDVRKVENLETFKSAREVALTTGVR